MKHADPKLDTRTSPPSRACGVGRKVVALSLRSFAYSPPVFSSRANNSRKGNGRENERSSGKKAARWGRRGGAYRRPRSTTVGIHRVVAKATPPRGPHQRRLLPICADQSLLATLPPDPRSPELAGYVAPRSAQPGALRLHRSELTDHAASQSGTGRSSPTASTGARRSATPPLKARGERWWWPLASNGREWSGEVAPMSTERRGEGRLAMGGW
uniref:Uncharacterized protein n=1 Tax=Oryza meridionalis TaxID=40149 RepID=A0A0E0DWW4_9ORYZ